MEVNNKNEFEQGRAIARREIREDRWTAQTARDYLRACQDLAVSTDGRDEFDRGFMFEINTLANEVSKRHRRPPIEF